MIDTLTERIMDQYLTDPEPDPAQLGTPTRPLASLTDDEYTTLFTLAFGSPAPADRPLHLHHRHIDKFDGRGSEYVEVKDRTCILSIHTDGRMQACKYPAGGSNFFPKTFNAYKVLIYLALLGIQFEHDE